MTLYVTQVSNSYLSEFLAQLQQEGYSIFLVTGVLPECDADLILQVPVLLHLLPRSPRQSKHTKLLPLASSRTCRAPEPVRPRDTPCLELGVLVLGLRMRLRSWRQP